MCVFGSCLSNFRRDYHLAVGILRIVSEVDVVVILSLEKAIQRTHFSDNVIDKVLLQIPDHMLNVLFLLWT